MKEKGLRIANRFVPIFYISPRGGHIGFQNGRHFHQFWVNISTSEQYRYLKMVKIPTILILTNAMKVPNKLQTILLLAAILNFKILFMQEIDSAI